MNPPGIITVSWCFNIYKYTQYTTYTEGGNDKKENFSKSLRRK